MHACPECDARYPSRWAAEECGEQDRRDALHARQQIRGRGKRKP